MNLQSILSPDQTDLACQILEDNFGIKCLFEEDHKFNQQNMFIKWSERHMGPSMPAVLYSPNLACHVGYFSSAGKHWKEIVTSNMLSFLSGKDLFLAKSVHPDDKFCTTFNVFHVCKFPEFSSFNEFRLKSEIVNQTPKVQS